MGTPNPFLTGPSYKLQLVLLGFLVCTTYIYFTDAQLANCLGIVTHVTLELDKLTYANLQPAKVDVQSAIPPPAGYKVPADIPYNLNEDQRKKAESNFIKQANSYYSEWFWYPYNEQVWVNCWYDLLSHPSCLSPSIITHKTTPGTTPMIQNGLSSIQMQLLHIYSG